MGGKPRQRCTEHLYMNQLCGILVATSTDKLFRGFCPDPKCGNVVAMTRQQVRNRGSRGFIQCNALRDRSDSDRTLSTDRRK